MSTQKNILFGGYAPVHFLCFRPVYELLRNDPDINVWLTGGFRHFPEGSDEANYDLRGFYDPFGVDQNRIAPFEQLEGEHFDVVVCSHSSTVFFPRSYGKAVQIFHGVSFKNFAVRDKVLKYDYACVAGRYHGERFESQDILGGGETQFLLTGFPKLDRLVGGRLDRRALLQGLGLSPDRPTILYAPTGGKHNSLDQQGEEIIRAIASAKRWNLMIKPHDHPKKAVNWSERLAPLENDLVRVVHDYDIIPYLFAADLLLTDASSVAMEYTLLDRPMVFIDVPELLENVKKRGGALDLDTYGRKIGLVAEGVGQLEPRISEALEDPGRFSELRRAAAQHLFHSPGFAADNVAGVIRHVAGNSNDLPPRVERLVSAGAAG